MLLIPWVPTLVNDGHECLFVDCDNHILDPLRHPWMPSVLTEGAFIMMPEQEAAVQTAEFQERYALGVADGLEAYFRALGSGR